MLPDGQPSRAVYRRDGRIFLQLWQTGRKSHPDYLDDQSPIGPSAIEPPVKPERLRQEAICRAPSADEEDIAATVDEYALSGLKRRF